MRWVVATLFSAICAIAGPSHAQVERYPARPVKVIVPAAAGGPTDIVARVLTDNFGSSLGGNFVVDNRPGATGTIGTAATASAKPDGYTLLLTASDPLIVAPLVMDRLAYDPKKDLVPLAHVGFVPLVIYVNANLPIHNIADLVAYTRKHKTSYASTGVGGVIHIFIEYLKVKTGASILHVPYKSVPAMLQDTAGGVVDLTAIDIASAAAFVETGKVRPIAITRRNKAMPSVESFEQQGVTEMESFSGWFSLVAPKGMDEGIARRLSAETLKFVRRPEVVERFEKLGIEPSGYDEKRAPQFIAQEQAKWAKFFDRIPKDQLK